MNIPLTQQRFSRRSFLTKTSALVGATVATSLIPSAYASVRDSSNAHAHVLRQVQFQHIDHWDVSRLNHILKVDTPAFTGFPVDYPAARNGVDLFRIQYPSVIPEQNNRPIMASGLIAIPQGVHGKRRLISYQHGTVYGKHQVPSFPDESPETKLMIAAFAGRGDVLIGADYFGMGLSDAPESYLVLGSQQQATVDMIHAARAVLEQLQTNTTGLYLTGWSEGGFVTMGLLERLQSDGVAVRAASTASAPVDLFMAMSGFLDFPRPNDAFWLNSIFILSAFAYENYYSAPGLAESFLNPQYIEVCRKAYERKPFNVHDIPTDLHRLIRPEYFNPNYFLRSEFGRLIHQNQVYRWVIETPTRNYYGEADEAIPVGLGKLASFYQTGMGNNQVTAVSAGPDATHRGTFARAAKGWSEWFDELDS